MDVEIGNAAGAIWRYLDQHGQATVAKLKQETKLSEQELYLGLGWLAREGNISIAREKRSLQVSLRER